MTISKKLTGLGLAVVAASALTLSACSNSETDSDKKVDTAQSAAKSTASSTAASSSSTSSSSASSASTSSSSVVLEDGFIKAMPAGKGMTAIFGTLKNTSDSDIQVTGFTTSLGDAPMYELHEVVDGVMREKEGGFIIPAGGTHVLKPGGDHMMIMGYQEAIAPGQEVSVSIKLKDGSKVDLGSIPAREIASGEESYGSDGNPEGHSGIDSSKQGEHAGHEGHSGHEGHKSN